PVPEANRMACAGHGTHVSGIAAAKSAGGNGSVTGVAPDATLRAYRVFGCTGSTQDDVMVAALERAANDGIDVINMSIGASYQWPNSIVSIASTRLMNIGVSVVV